MVKLIDIRGIWHNAQVCFRGETTESIKVKGHVRTSRLAHGCAKKFFSKESIDFVNYICIQISNISSVFLYVNEPSLTVNSYSVTHLKRN